MSGWTLVVAEIGRIALTLALIVGRASAHADSPPAEFYRGIDLNRPPVEIDDGQLTKPARRDSKQARPRDPGAAATFDAQIAPILAKHCLECHGRSFQKGKLALSNKDAALSGGESGTV